MQNRLKSPALWASVLALVTFVLKDWLAVEIPKADIFCELLLAVLTGFGILNNPTEKNKF